MSNKDFENSEHISFEEMEYFIFEATPFEPEGLELGARVNCHIQSCDKCRKLYESMLKISDLQDEIALSETESKCLFALIKAGADNVIEKLKHFGKQIRFGIGEFSQIINPSQDFGHPTLRTVMMSSGENASNEEDVSLIDSSIRQNSESGRQRINISAAQDGTLTVYLDAAEYPEGRYVLLVPDGDAETVAGKLERYSSDLCYVCFEDVSEGDYTVILEEQGNGDK